MIDQSEVYSFFPEKETFEKLLKTTYIALITYCNHLIFNLDYGKIKRSPLCFSIAPIHPYQTDLPCEIRAAKGNAHFTWTK